MAGARRASVFATAMAGAPAPGVPGEADGRGGEPEGVQTNTSWPAWISPETTSQYVPSDRPTMIATARGFPPLADLSLPPPLPDLPAPRYRSGTPPAAGPTPRARERGDGARSRDAETCFGLPTFPRCPTTTFRDSPPFDLLCIPGGFGVDQAIEDEETMDFVRREGGRARYAPSAPRWVTASAPSQRCSAPRPCRPRTGPAPRPSGLPARRTWVASRLGATGRCGGRCCRG